jgi:CDP-ribitol ribitolphosphotransferase
MKLLPTQNKVTFISRQGNQNSLDFNLIQAEMKQMDPRVKIVSLNKRFRDIDPISVKMKYCFHIITQMYHIATSKVVVLETYCMPISMLKHKKNLKVIQMWHALGSLKKFGYSVIDKKEGSTLASVAKMHKNYDVILTSSVEARKHFAEAFGYPETQFKILPLPRVDYLMNTKIQKKLQETLKKEYPNLKNKKTIVYAPTFRKNGEDITKILELINVIDYEQYNLVLKLHPLTKIEIEDKRPILDKKYPTIDWLSSADVVITDYSAIIYEAALLKKAIILYAYDLDDYETDRDFYLNYKEEIPGVIARTSEEVSQALQKNNHDIKKVIDFSNKYVAYHKQDCTKNLAHLILKMKSN